MRIACIFPMSGSRFRHKQVNDEIHLAGLVSVEKYLANHDHTVRVFDYLADDVAGKKALDRKLVEFNPRILAICAAFRAEDVTEFLSVMPRLNPKPSILCFGTGAIDYELCFDRAPLLDFVVPVEPEPVIADLAGILQAGAPVEKIEGLAFRSESGVTFSKRAGTPLNIMVDDGDVGRYFSQEVPKMAFVWGSRGCWYRKCTFCNVGAASSLTKGQGWIPWDMECIMANIEKLSRRKANYIHFLDAEFIGPGQSGRSRSRAIAREIIRSGMKIKFAIDSRIDCIEEETFRLLKEAGLVAVFIGIESGCQAILDRLNKGFTVADVEKSVGILRRLKINFRTGWLLSDPEGTLEEVRESLRLIPKLRLFDGLGVSNVDYSAGVGSVFCEFHLHAGTPMYRQVVSRHRSDDAVESEMPCAYADERLMELAVRLLPFRREIGNRYRWLKMVQRDNYKVTSSKPWSQRRWQRGYEYALNVLAFKGLEQQVDDLLAKTVPPRCDGAHSAPFERILRRHDEFWLGTDFGIVREHGPR